MIPPKQTEFTSQQCQAHLSSDCALLTNESLSGLTYILELLLPLAQLTETPAWSESILSKLKDTSIATGSRTENFHLPMMLAIDEDFFVTEFEQSDLDVMHLWGFAHVLNEDALVDDELPRIIIETAKCHPGYSRLRVIDKSGKIPEYTFVHESSEHHYLHASSMMDKEYERYNLSHGPAGISILVVAEQDHVFCLKCNDWPKAADKWLSRHPSSEWPSQETINEVSKQGCLLVPVAHPKSAVPALEWRLSFSVAEKMLAQTLNETQRRCYLILKILFSTEMKLPKGLCSYHMKTILFWACENISPAYWRRDNMAACLLYLLDRLVLCLASRNMPHYFLPENNLIDHLTPATIQTLAAKAVDIRKDPVKFLLQFKESRKFFTGPFSGSASAVLRPILTDWMCHFNHDRKDMKCVEAGLDIAALFITDAPLCHHLATDMLTCYGKLFKGKYALRNHVQTVIQPLLCALDVLDTVSVWATSHSLTGETPGAASTLPTNIIENCRLFYNENTVSDDVQKSQLDGTLRGGLDPSLKDLAAILSLLLLPTDTQAYAAQLRRLSENLSSPVHQIQEAQQILCLVFAYMMTLLYCPIDEIWHRHLGHLEEVRAMFSQWKQLRYYTCTTVVLASAYLRIGAMSKLLTILENLSKSSPTVALLKRLIAEKVQKCSRSPAASSERYVDQYFNSPDRIMYGSVFDMKCPDGRSQYYQWEIMYFVKFKTLPDSNAFKKAFGKLAEKFCIQGIEHSKGNMAKQTCLHADYANFLVDSGRYTEALNILESVIADVKGAEYDVYNEYAGYLKLVVYKDLFRGLSRSIHRKISFHSLIYAYFFAVKSLVQLNDLQCAVDMARRMESECDAVYTRTKDMVPWEVSANNYSLLGHAYRLCRQISRAILAFSLVTRLREDTKQPEPHSHIGGMQEFCCAEDAHLKDVSETYIKVLWPHSSVNTIWPLLLKTLYPHLPIERSAVHFFHLIYDRYPTVHDMKPFLQVIASSLSCTPGNMAQFALALSVFIETIYPDTSLLSGLRSCLHELNPELYSHDSLGKYVKSLISEDHQKISIAKDEVIKKFFSEDPQEEGIVILTRYVSDFLRHLPIKEALKEYFLSMYPASPLEESVRAYFESDDDETADNLLEALERVVQEIKEKR